MDQRLYTIVPFFLPASESGPNGGAQEYHECSNRRSSASCGAASAELLSELILCCATRHTVALRCMDHREN